MSSDRPRPPSVARLLAAARPHVAAETDPDALTAVAREVVADERARLAAGEPSATIERLADDVRARLGGFTDPAGSGLVTVLNATGVILHTNLGRAPWPAEAIAAAPQAAAAGYSLLELDRDDRPSRAALPGRRGPSRRADRRRGRAGHDQQCRGPRARRRARRPAAASAVSRGELVEIGGGVRIPEIVRRAGARLIEVGTTNRTRAADFEAPLADGRAVVVLRVHPSNFAQTGFVEAPDPVEVARVAHAHGAIVIDDLGSGALLDTAAFGLAHEPTPAERLAAGRGSRHVQRRQARRRAAGGAARRSGAT